MSSRAVVPPKAARVRVSARAAVLLVLVLLVLAFAVTPLRALMAERSKLADLQRQATALQRQDDALQERVLQLRDPAYLERLARECLGMVQPGELAFVTVPQHGPPPATADC